MTKKNKLVSVKLLPKADLAIQGSQTQPKFPFSVKGIVEGKKMIFKGSMKVIREKKVEFIFDELSVSLDDWFDECQQALKNAVINQLSKQASNR
jgi:hypothetical protein